MTKREKFEAIVAMVGADAMFEDKTSVKDFLTAEIERMNRKKSGPRKPTATQLENESLMDKLVEVVTKPIQIKELLMTDEFSADKGFSSQKISALMRKLVLAERIKKIKGDKGVTLFAPVDYVAPSDENAD